MPPAPRRIPGGPSPPVPEGGSLRPSSPPPPPRPLLPPPPLLMPDRSLDDDTDAENSTFDLDDLGSYIGPLATPTLDGTAVVPSLGEVIVDTTPPLITILGNGKLMAVDGGSHPVMVHYLTIWDTWADPGVIAMDDTLGNLTSIVQVTGALSIDTAKPTGGKPHEILYAVKDAMGNSATARREVHVNCPENTILCEVASFQDASGTIVTERTCSAFGVCDLNPAYLFGGIPVGSGSEQEKYQLLQMSFGLPYTAPIRSSLQPVIELVGPAVLTLPQGMPYAACSPEDPPGRTCDRGALAYSIDEGDLTSQVSVCSSSAGSSSSTFQSAGLAACAIDTTVPGNRSITFTVRSMKDPSIMAEATRVLVIHHSCDVGERLCGDMTTCSKDLICESDLLYDASIWPERVWEYGPPLPNLLELDLIGPSQVSIPQGTSYVACRDGKAPTGSSPCDQGAVIRGASHSENSLRVLALPETWPAARCLEESCVGAEFAARGLSGCGLNTSAPAGTVVVIQFAAVDAATATVATVNRTVIIAPPCDSNEYVCGNWTCSPVPCDMRDALLGASGALQLELLGPELLVVQYGAQALPVIGSILPCSSADQADGCGAVATSGEGVDISSRISVWELEDCASGSADTCNACAPDALAQGQCLPGRYSYRYSVNSENGGQEVTRDRVVVVAEVGMVELRLVLASTQADENGNSSLTIAEAESLAVSVLTVGSPLHLALLEAVSVGREDLELGTLHMDNFVVTSAWPTTDANGRVMLEVLLRAELSTWTGSDDGGASAANPSGGSRRRLQQLNTQISLQDGLETTRAWLLGKIESGAVAQTLRDLEVEGLSTMAPLENLSQVSARQLSSVVDTLSGILVSGISAVHRITAKLSATLSLVSDDPGTMLHLGSYNAEATRSQLLGSYQDMIAENRNATDLLLPSLYEIAEGCCGGGSGATAEMFTEALALMKERLASLDRSLARMHSGFFESIRDGASSDANALEPETCAAFASARQGTYNISFSTSPKVPGNTWWNR